MTAAALLRLARLLVIDLMKQADKSYDMQSYLNISNLIERIACELEILAAKRTRKPSSVNAPGSERLS